MFIFYNPISIKIKNQYIYTGISNNYFESKFRYINIYISIYLYFNSSLAKSKINIFKINKYECESNFS